MRYVRELRWFPPSKRLRVRRQLDLFSVAGNINLIHATLPESHDFDIVAMIGRISLALQCVGAEPFGQTEKIVYGVLRNDGLRGVKFRRVVVKRRPSNATGELRMFVDAFEIAHPPQSKSE